ncbi:MAG: glycosyl transferase [Croceicoccus sp.]|nr:glycosyl transferase [Croceicoccus sp.]MAL25554.1 glycosyl transferase [Croceicoccus sp.]|tara:strand:- start:143979 stop:145100 length:1122 start_codon:yes stop_codon:yes gene_type:complete
MPRIAVVGLRGMTNVIGGIETHCRNLYPALASKRPDFDITIYQRNAYHHENASLPPNLTVRPIWAPKRRAAEAFLHTLFAILAASLNVRPRILHIHAIGPGLWTPLARLLGMRVIVTIHARDYDRPKWSWPIAAGLKLGENLSCRFANAVVCVSQAGLQDISARYPRHTARFHAIPHGLDPPLDPDGAGAGVFDELGVQPGRYLLAVGRFDRTKRFHDLVCARQALRKEAMPLVIVGSGVGDHEVFTDLVDDGVVLAGSRFGDELVQLYRNASLFIHPSQMEGFGLVVLEALNTGIPIALSDLPQHREFGLADHCYFKVGDIAAISKIMAHQHHAAFRPALSPSALMQFTHAGMVEKYEQLIEEIGFDEENRP